ncbi:MAG: SGNH/GDSL hydrolase family protein [Lentisphaeria bacterium]|jgi:lysophospholipase L1-like esterase
MPPLIRPNDRILFQGDSITDAGRRDTPDGLGNGYVAQIRGSLQALRPDLPLRILNRGIGGDRTAELLARWHADCLDLEPDVLSLMIGVNDVWRKRGTWQGQAHIPLPEFTANLSQLLELARTAGIRQLVLLSPTTIDHANDSDLNQMLGDYAAAAQRLATTFDALYIPARETLLAARRQAPEVNWTPDGCHPSPAGHALLAATWLQATGLAGPLPPPPREPGAKRA